MFAERVKKKLKPWTHRYCGGPCDPICLAPTLKNATKLYEDEYTRPDNTHEAFSNSVLKGVLRSLTGVAFGNWLRPEMVKEKLKGGRVWAES